VPELREYEAGCETQGGATRMEDSEDTAGRVDPEDSPVPGLPETLPVYSAHPDDVDDGSSGVWAGMDADEILREDARERAKAANVVFGVLGINSSVSIDETQREAGILSRNAETEIRNNETQLDDAFDPVTGKALRAPEPGNRARRRKEEQVWQNMSTSGTSVPTGKTLTETRTTPAPPFGLAPLGRVEGTVASPRRLSHWTLRSATQTGRTPRVSNAPPTFDMARTAEMDIFDEMTAAGEATPATPEDPPMKVRIDVETDVETAYDDFWWNKNGANAIELVRATVRWCLAHGQPFSDDWDRAHEQQMNDLKEHS